LSSRKIIAAVLKNKTPSTQEEQYKNEKNIEVAAKAVKVPGINWIIVFEQPVSEALGFVDFMRGLFIVTLLGSLLVLLLIALVLSENLTGSIQKLQHLTQLLEIGQLDSNIKITTGDEIESLANAFKKMAAELLQREGYLKKEKQERETLLQSLTDGVIAVDSENKIILFNKEAERIIGLTAESILNKNIDEILDVYDQDQHIVFNQYKAQSEEMIRKLKEKGIYLLNRSGEKIKITMTTTPVISENQTQSGWVITLHDMRKEQELEEMKLDFVSMAAHELRTPLTAIRGYASLLNIQVAQNLDSAGKELINRLLISTENLSNLIDNLLNVSRIERDAFRVDLRPVDITGLIKDIVDGLKQQAYTQNQKLECQLPLEPLPRVYVDPFRIGQVLLNLIGNALNYTQEGGSIVVTAAHKDGFVQVSVKDNGNGIPKEAIPKLFTKFFRVSGQLEQGSKGTGLGLFICKSIIEMHKGKIWVESELGKGSTFTFAVPIATEKDVEEYNKRTTKNTLTQENGDSMMIKK
jgi:PAS domain S-box-containing protein